MLPALPLSEAIRDFSGLVDRTTGLAVVRLSRWAPSASAAIAMLAVAGA
jgi:hypothetical protein